ncbi:MAG: hypothetical protein AABY05_01235 [Nanoarchaeota archaeon]
MENPKWMDKLLNLVEEVKKETPKQTLTKENIILKPKTEGLLWFEMLKALNSINNKKEIIPFPFVFEKICRRFSIKKAKAWNCLFFLAEFGLIDIVRFHGIRLNYRFSVQK